MKNRDGLENSDNWGTPKWLYDELDSVFHFDFDPCPLYAGFDGLSVPWGESNFINPPYNRIDKPKFIDRAIREYKFGKACVLLLPSATGTKQFHELMEICLNFDTWENWLENRFFFFFSLTV